MLQAELQGQDLKEFMAPHVAAAKSLMEKGGTGAKPTLLTYIKRIFENDKNYMSPVDFEQKVLMWKHTPTILAQAKSKQSAKAYPLEGIAQVALTLTLKPISVCCSLPKSCEKSCAAGIAFGRVLSAVLSCGIHLSAVVASFVFSCAMQC